MTFHFSNKGSVAELMKFIDQSDSPFIAAKAPKKQGCFFSVNHRQGSPACFA